MRTRRSGSTTSAGSPPGWADLGEDLWRIDQDGVVDHRRGVRGAHAIDAHGRTQCRHHGHRRRPVPAGRVDPGSSVVGQDQVDRLSRLWFEALRGICAHVNSGGGGLTPSDVLPAKLSQRQIDELAEEYTVADVLPLTPVQQGLLFHSTFARAAATTMTCTRYSSTSPSPNRRPAQVARRGPHRGRPAPESGGAFCGQFGEPVQVILADPVMAWRYLDLRGDDRTADEEVRELCDNERAAVCDLSERPTFRAALIRTAGNEHRFVLTFHHIVIDGWSLPILLREVFASYFGSGFQHWRRIATSSAGWSARTGRRPRGLAKRLGGLRDSHPGRTAGRAGPPGASRPTRVPAETTRALGELARSQRTTVATVLQAGAGAAADVVDRSARRAFGTAVSGRPTDLAGADQMVGLLINTVPVRARTTATTTVAEPAGAAAGVPTTTPPSMNTWRSPTFTTSPAMSSCSTPCSRTRATSIDTSAFMGVQELAVTEFNNREYNHYLLSVMALPGHELGLRSRIRQRRDSMSARSRHWSNGSSGCWWT